MKAIGSVTRTKHAMRSCNFGKGVVRGCSKLVDGSS